MSSIIRSVQDPTHKPLSWNGSWQDRTERCEYTYVEAFMNERTRNWIRAHVHMFEFFGGVTPMLVDDNCTTAVDHRKSDWCTPVLNTTYHEMAEHYNIAILPARVCRPKDKPNVEGSVGKISTWITAALRKEQFFSLAELNLAIRKKLDVYNARQFQKKECSRLSLFLGEEQPLLASLEVKMEVKSK